MDDKYADVVEKFDGNFKDLAYAYMEIEPVLESLHSYAGVQVLLQSILDEAYPPNTIVCSDKEGADTGAQLTAAARKILELKTELAETKKQLAQAEQGEIDWVKTAISLKLAP